jgi:hypothetical protein
MYVCTFNLKEREGEKKGKSEVGDRSEEADRRK